MPKFLFWNVGRKPISAILRTLTTLEEVDVVILAELQDDPIALLAALNAETADLQYCPGICPLLHFYTRFDHRFLKPAREARRYSIRTLSMPAREELLIAAAHLPSRMQFGETDIGVECQLLAKEIGAEEDVQGHTRTLLIGDFNLNPFDDGIVLTTGFHASMSQEVARKGSRTVQGNRYRFFYNPMWSVMTDRDGNTAGTYYYDKAQHKNFFWNTFDQVLLRPALLGGFRHDKLRVLTTIGTQCLVDAEGRPDTKIASDHLPLMLELDF